jgi:cytochrome bd ubiquinol oxidase subunit II
MTADVILAGLVLAALVIYSLLGGADYGAGFWDLMCSGPRQQDQRDLIARAIQPVWETNHIWLILVVVLMFSGFPAAFSEISLGAAVPIFLILLGIVLRGSSYVFRAYFTGSVRTQLYWGKVFSISSSITPLFLGIVIGAISSDAVLVKNGISENGFLRTWFQPFPLIVGVLSLSHHRNRRCGAPKRFQEARPIFRIYFSDGCLCNLCCRRECRAGNPRWPVPRTLCLAD